MIRGIVRLEPPLIVLGGGGHAKVLLSALALLRRKVIGFVDSDAERKECGGLARLGGDETVLLHSAAEVMLVNGVGSVRQPTARRRIFEEFRSKGYRFETVVHPSCLVARESEIAEGAQLMAGVVVQAGTSIGQNSILNTGSQVDHDCVIGAHVHLAPGAVLSGGIQVGNGAHVGTGACIVQGVKIGAGSLVGAGAVVVRDVPPGVTVVGVPARILPGLKQPSEIFQ